MDKFVIEVKNLSKNFGNIKAVDNITLNIKTNEVFGFLGPNGAGKTTTIRLLLNFLFPSSGSIKVLNQDPINNSASIMKEVGYIAGEISLWNNYSVKELLSFLEKIRGENGKLKNDLIKRFQLDTSRKINNLSKGNKQKVAIIQAFMHEPKLLILDEPTSGLDPLLQLEFYKLLEESKAKGATVFFSSHVLSEVQRVCDRVGIIKDGKLISIETIKEIQQKNIYDVTVNFKNSFKPELNSIKDSISKLKIHSNSMQFTYKGEVNTLLLELAKFELSFVRILEPSLEDLFLAYYKNND